MEAVASVLDKLKGLAKSTQDFADGVLPWRKNARRRSPIEILKRLQREAFSDLMKLRDRQDRVEKVLSFYKSSSWSPFQESGTTLRGDIDVSAALLMMDSVDQQCSEAVGRAGIETGVNSRFTFESIVRERDYFIAELLASQRDQRDDLGNPLSISKIVYAAYINDWFSTVAIPVGAQCRDVGTPRNSFHREKGLTDYSCLEPPLMSPPRGSALGLTVKKSNITAHLAQFVSGLSPQPGSDAITRCFSTFGQVVYKISRSTKLSLVGIHHVPKLSYRLASLGAMAMPVRIFRRRKGLETQEEAVDMSNGANTAKNVFMDGSIAMTLESELDESTKIGGWVEMKRSNPGYLQWAVTIADTPEDYIGWGLSLGGLVQGPTSWDHFQVETFLRFNLGNKFRLQPALLYLMDGTTQFPALMFQSSWSM